jgi:predicted RNA-binding Zn-ribbon protein involved in translation (DUF1610 family)
MIKKGTKIICPKCGTCIGEFKRTVRRGEVLKTDDINFFIGNFKNGDYAICPKCGFPFSVSAKVGPITDTLIHTEEGWLPMGLPTELLMPAIEKFLEKRKEKEKKGEKGQKKATRQ